jgi:hypothetical protein
LLGCRLRRHLSHSSGNSHFLGHCLRILDLAFLFLQFLIVHFLFRKHFDLPIIIGLLNDSFNVTLPFLSISLDSRLLVNGQLLFFQKNLRGDCHFSTLLHLNFRVARHGIKHWVLCAYSVLWLRTHKTIIKYRLKETLIQSITCSRPANTIFSFLTFLVQDLYSAINPHVVHVIFCIENGL